MTRSVLLLLGLCGVLAGCSWGSGGSSHSGPTRLVITDGGTQGYATTTLRCFPPSGTHPDPKAACAGLVFLLDHHAVPPRHCANEAYGPWATVRGLYRGQRINLSFAEACATGKANQAVQALAAGYSHG